MNIPSTLLSVKLTAPSDHALHNFPSGANMGLGLRNSAQEELQSPLWALLWLGLFDHLEEITPEPSLRAIFGLRSERSKRSTDKYSGTMKGCSSRWLWELTPRLPLRCTKILGWLLGAGGHFLLADKAKEETTTAFLHKGAAPLICSGG